MTVKQATNFGSGGSASGGTPGGSSTQIQYNNGGAFGGVSGATSDGTNLAVTTQATTDNSTKAASTAYVTTAIANAVAGVNPAVSVKAATTQAADTSGLTYNNGAAGIGATFTGAVNTALVIDGITFTAVNQRLLVKNDTQSPSGAFNGVYYVTQIQTAILPPILTRALDYNAPGDINDTGAIPVVSGTVNANTSWLLTTRVTTVGTDPLTYTQFSYSPTSAANSIKGNNTGSPAITLDLTVDQVIAMLGLLSITPQGRLTLSSTLPVLTGDAVAQTTVYYLGYAGTIVPVYDGTQFVNKSIGAAGISLALDSNSGHTGYQQSGKNFDIFAYLSSGTLVLASGPAWTSDTARADAITQVNGVWVNNATIVLKKDATAGTESIAANLATYLGTMRATADGQTGMAFKPVALTGGTNNVLGLYNAYNRVKIQAQCLNSTTSWTYNSATPRAPNASSSMRINFIDGLQQSNVVSRYRQIIQAAASAAGHYMSSNLDVTNLHGGITGNLSAPVNAIVTVANETAILPQMGFHFVSAIESSNNAGTGTFFGAGVNPNLIGGGLYLEMDM